MVTALPVPLLPFIRDEFALDYTQSGLIISVFAIVYGFSQLPAGWLADRIGPRILITISISGVALCGLLIGLSQTYLMLIILLIVMGVLGGGYHPVSAAMISAVVEPRNLGRALGFHMIGGSIAYFLIPPIAAVIAAALGWRSPFILLAIPAIIFGVVFHVLLRRQEFTKITKSKTASSHAKIKQSAGRLRHVIVILIPSTFSQAALLSVAAFMPLYLVDYFGTSKEMAAASLAFIYSAGLWAGPVGGYLSDRWGRLLILFITCFGTGVIFYLLNLTPYGLGTVAILVIIGIIMYINTTVAQAHIVDHTPEYYRSTILGIYFFGALEGNGVLMPVIGYLIDKFGFHSSFTITGVAVVVVSLVSLAILQISRDQPPVEQQ